jgi:pimeloyl-ACP methyl ester carboxylesterase
VQIGVQKPSNDVTWGHLPHLLAVWGKSDPFFLPPGAEAFKRDNPDAELHFYDTGHFALETHHRGIADTIREFLNRKLATQASAA